jgi:isocitrate dehydrogenase kinase/phosphatase
VVVEWCVMCKNHGESVDHLLLHYDVARVVWSFFYSLFGVEWVMPSSVVDLLRGWGTLLGRDPVFRIWKQVPLCVLWGL